MLAARLHGARDLRIERLPRPAAPGPGQALIRIAAVGICGSDLHTYTDGRIGDTLLTSPVIPGHEFAGYIEAVGPDSVDGNFQPLAPGPLAAIEPAQTCGHCPQCERGNPNFCHHIRFCGLHPHDGALCEYMLVPSRTCFPLPSGTDPAIGALLETFGVAIHAVDLARIRVGSRVAVIGAGPIGLCVAQLARLAGAEVYTTDPLPWRLALAQKLGIHPLPSRIQNPESRIPSEISNLKSEISNLDSFDTALECANAGPALQHAADLLRPGGTLVAVGIPGDDRFELRHSTIRRKGLTILCVRRMKLTYPRAIRLWQTGQVDLASLISHRFPLSEADRAFRLNSAYEPSIIKAIVEPTR